MRIKLLLIFALSTGFLFVSVACADSTGVIKEPGISSFESKGICTAALKKSAQGGYLQLFIYLHNSNPVHVADDITAIAWVNSNLLAYSVSPIYGKPGVFVVACDKKPRVSRLVAPESIDSAYPDGADYFEIQSVSKNQIRYYYDADVDKMDLERLRSDKHLHMVKIHR